MNVYEDFNLETTQKQLIEDVNSALITVANKSAKLNVLKCKGAITEVKSNAVHAYIPGAKQGQLCRIHKTSSNETTLAEVTAITNNHIVLQPYSASTSGISCNDYVVPLENEISLYAGEHLKGSVVDALGNTIAASHNGAQALTELTSTPLFNTPPNALTRPIISESLSVGVRSIDALLTIGQGQRLGIFAPAGAGKSTLLGMITRFTEADIVVLGLIGERGREVNEFLDHVLGEEARKNSVVVIATSDRPAIEKVKAIYTATSIAEFFRDQGKKVLLLVDSLTRYARAQRDVAIASGEHIPSTGYPASVFSELPLILERTGCNEKGSITALYTVLVEDENADDIIAEEVRSILDGHIILSRKLAASNHYPAIDVLGSISRVMHQVTSDKHRDSAGKFRNMLSKYKELELLIRVGEYQKGEDKEADQAVERYPELQQFLQQRIDSNSSSIETLQSLLHVTRG